MKLFSLLYVSHSRLVQSNAQEEVEAIVETSVVNNERHKITGALLFTGMYFAQILEGKEPAVVELMAAISRDDRHDRIQIINTRSISRRRFPGWSLAYFGPSGFVAGHVMRVFEARSPAEQQEASRMLELLLEEFAGSRVAAVG